MPRPEVRQDDGPPSSLPMKEREYATQPCTVAFKMGRSPSPPAHACLSGSDERLGGKKERGRSKQSSMSSESQLGGHNTCFEESSPIHPVMDSFSETQNMSMVSHWQWQSWLLAWEKRQEILLKRHEDVTREVVVAAVKDLNDRIMIDRPKPILLPMMSGTLSERPIRSSIQAHLIQHASEKSTTLREKFSQFSAEVMGNYEPRCGRQASVPREYPPVGLQGHLKLGSERNTFRDQLPLEKVVATRTEPLYESQEGTSSNSVAPAIPAVKSRISIPQPSRRLKTPHKPKNCARAALLRLVHHPYFIRTSSLMIALYTIIVGVMADVDMRAASRDQESPAWLSYTDAFFTFAFALEVLAKLLAEGSFFFTSIDRMWNTFDLTLACLGLSDILTAFEGNLSFLRVLRAFRAVRILRVLRAFPCFKELRLMAESICTCMVSLGWALTLLIAVMYIFAVVLLRGASDSLRSTDLEPKSRQVLQGDFGTLLVTLFSLTQAVSGGRSWGEFAEPFVQVSIWFAACFPLFIVFVIFGAMNILTGIFVENTASLANFDKDLAVEEELSRIQQVVLQIRDFFEELDQDRSGTLSFNELERALEDDKVKAYFSVLQMDVTDAESLFQLLDHETKGEVSIEEFVLNCMRLRGGPRNMDVASFIHEQQRLHLEMKSMSMAMDKKISVLVDKVTSATTR